METFSRVDGCVCLLTAAKLTSLENKTPPGVDAAPAMRILEEIEREEAAAEDEDERTREDKAS